MAKSKKKNIQWMCPCGAHALHPTTEANAQQNAIRHYRRTKHQWQFLVKLTTKGRHGMYHPWLKK